jgi:hypothetical protein
MRAALSHRTSFAPQLATYRPCVTHLLPLTFITEFHFMFQEPHAVVLALHDVRQTLHLGALSWSSVKSYSTRNCAGFDYEMRTVSNCLSPRLWFGTFPQDNGGGFSNVFHFDAFMSFPSSSDGFSLDLYRFSCGLGDSAADIKLHDIQRIVDNAPGELVQVVSGNDDNISRYIVQQFYGDADIEQLSDAGEMEGGNVRTTQWMLHHVCNPLKTNASDALFCLAQRGASQVDDSGCAYVKHLKHLLSDQAARLDAVKHVARVSCFAPMGTQLQNALELLHIRSSQLRYLWSGLLTQSGHRPNAYIGAALHSAREYKEIEIAHQSLAACHRVIASCSAVNREQCYLTQEHPFLDGPHPHPISPSFYTGNTGIFHQVSRDFLGREVVSDVDAVMLFLNNPAASELLNVSAWSHYVTSRGPHASPRDVLHCCNLAACIYGSIGSKVPSVSHRRAHDAANSGMRLTLPIGSTCAALCLQIECYLRQGIDEVVVRGRSVEKAMLVSGPFIQPGTTVVDVRFDAPTDSSIFKLSIPHTLQERDANAVLSFARDEEWVTQQQSACFSTLFSQVEFLKNVFTTSQSQALDNLSQQPYPEPSDLASADVSQRAPSSLLHVARTALVACTSALVELAAPGPDRARAMDLEEEVMTGLYELVRAAFDDDTFGVLLDISCNAYHRASNGGAGVKAGDKEMVIARTLSLFNYVDVHEDSLFQIRRNSFIRCLSSSDTPYSQLLQSHLPLTQETRILQAYTHKCLSCDTPFPNPFGSPLPLSALPDSESGPPCLPHSYEAHTCLIILCDLAQYLHSPAVKRSHEPKLCVHPTVPRLIIDVFMCRLHMPDAAWNSGPAAADTQLLHAPLSHELCYVGWRLCCWLICGRLPQHQQVYGTDNGDEMKAALSGAFSPGGKVAGNAMQNNMAIMNDIPPDVDMSAAYWNASNGSLRDVSMMLCSTSRAT